MKEYWYMIDMHTHILPGVDDGAENMEMAIDMIRHSVEYGTEEILLTPHGNIMGEYENNGIRKLKEQYSQLQQVLKKEKIDVKLHLGMEVFGTYDIDEKIRKSEVLPIENSQYMLVEFSFEEDVEYMFMILQKIRGQGLKPIIAHPERYSEIKRNPAIVYEWNRMNYGIQINKDSLSGKFGKREERVAFMLLDSNLVQIIASDCHDCYNRKSGLRNIYEYIKENYSEGYAELLMKINPSRVLKDEKLLIINPRRV